MGTLQVDINRVRSFVRDWPKVDNLTGSATAGATTLTVADATTGGTPGYGQNWPIQVDQEVMRVVSGAGATLTVIRGDRGTTAAAHASGATVLVRPNFFDSEITDLLNEASDSCWPYIYKEVIDTTITIAGSTYEYTIPFIPTTSVPIPMISTVEAKEVGDFAWRPTRRWEVRRGATPKVKFFELLPVGTQVRIRGYGPFPHRALPTDSMDAQWPVQADQLCTLYTAGMLLLSGEAGRVRVDTAAVDAREQANRAGSSSSIGQILLQRFRLQLDAAQMPRMPVHCVATM